MAGGIVGSTKTGSITFDGCINYANVSSSLEAGGIVGRGDSPTLNIQNCINFGNILSTVQYGAGIISRIQSGTNISVQYCANLGSITSTYAGGDVYLGGIIGKQFVAGTCSYLYNGAENIAGVSTKYIGGIVGVPFSSTYDHCNTVKVPQKSHDNLRGYNSGTFTNYGVVGDKSMEDILDALNHETATLTYRINTAKVQNGEGVYEDVTRIEPIYNLTKAPATTIGLQISKVVDETYSIRFISVVNSLNYDEAGVVISAVIHTTDAEGNPITLNVEETYPIETVYTSVLAETATGEKTEVAPYGTYFLTCKMMNIDAADTIKFTVRPYTTVGTVTTTGTAMEVTVHNGIVQ